VLEVTVIKNLAKSALPSFADYIDEHGYKSFFHLLQLLEDELLKELQRMMRGEELDRESVQRAARIMEEVSIVNEATSKAELP